MLIIENLSLDEKTKLKRKIGLHQWITAGGQIYRVKNMTTVHIENLINCWHGKGRTFISPTYLGGKEKWLEILNLELYFRKQN